ncbi:MAG: hemolysin family protein [Sphingomonadaceae bacterium]|nr:hemolysin family protein [Sphingomonadaceae bacterium]
MSDPYPSTEPGFWTGLKSLILGRGHEPTLREEIADAIETHAAATPHPGDLSVTERLMLSNLLDLSERRVADAAVPRTDMIAFDLAHGFDDLVRAFAEAGHSRMPVFRGSLDQIEGMIHVKDIYACMAAGEACPPESLMRPVLFVPPSMRVLDLLARMRRDRTHMAILIDEFGGVDGLLTIEDLVEQIVGDIEDEHDDAEAPVITPLPEGGWEADARADLSALAEVTGHDLNALCPEDVDTLGGLIFALAGRVPEPGETIEAVGGWRFEVTAADGRRIERARVLAPSPAPELEAAA